MAVVIFNFRGIAMCAIAFAIAFAIGAMTGLTGEGPLMIIAGPILAACDLAYRLGTKNGHWFSPDRGGSLFFLPAWCFGILWLVLGIIYVVSPQAAARSPVNGAQRSRGQLDLPAANGGSISFAKGR